MANEHAGLPAPLVPGDVSLTDFPFMPLDVARLRDSDLATNETPEACWAAVLLWCASWHQSPAASVPDDDQWLARVCGYLARGRIDPTWKKVRSGALHGWVKCSDGRLYHPVVAEKARDAWRSKQMQRWKTECARIKKHNQRHGTDLAQPEFEEWLSQGCPQGQPLPVPRDRQPPSQGRPEETHSKGQGEGQGQGEGFIDDDGASEGGAVDNPPGPPPPPLSDDAEVPKTAGAWARWYEAEEGVAVEQRSPADQGDFRRMAQGWVNGRLTVGQMRRAIEKARALSSEGIAWLPGYVDRVLSSQSVPPKAATAAASPRQAAAAPPTSHPVPTYAESKAAADADAMTPEQRAREAERAAEIRRQRGLGRGDARASP